MTVLQVPIILWLTFSFASCQFNSDNELNSLSEAAFIQHFSKCKRSSSGFDDCIRDALNAVRPYFKRGVPELELPPFDPFYAKEVLQERGGAGFNYKLKLKNVREQGWTFSMVTKFKTDPQKSLVQYTQYFPDKYLQGDYEITGNLMASNMANKGVWNLTLYNLVQTTTITRPPNGKQLKVYVDVQSIGDLDLHVSNLLLGRSYMENMLDRIINTTWRPFFRMIRPLINDLVSTAFTDIFNNAFNNFDFNKILP